MHFYFLHRLSDDNYLFNSISEVSVSKQRGVSYTYSPAEGAINVSLAHDLSAWVQYHYTVCSMSIKLLVKRIIRVEWRI